MQKHLVKLLTPQWNTKFAGNNVLITTYMYIVCKQQCF